MKTEKRHKILIVDDCKSNIDILLAHLCDAYDIIPARSGQTALDIVEKTDIDLILLDIIMPEMDGYEVCRQLKKMDSSKNIPVIFITVETDEDAIERAYDSGGSDYVSKPFKPKELLALIRRELQVHELIKDLEESKRELKILAATDPLTGLHNRRSFLDFSSHILGLAKREQTDLSLLMLDIDHFKRINDSWGHDVGDEVIKAVAAILKTSLRQNDIVCRHGGEEFVVLLPQTPLAGASALAEKIRREIESFSHTLNNGGILQCTISIGVTQVDPQRDMDLKPTLKRADMALYLAKDGGRNRVVSI